MKDANKKPFESLYGFRGPGFSVDSQGNITANSINVTVSGSPGTDLLTSFTVTESGGVFRFDGIDGDNPTITLYRGNTYTFNLTLSTLYFNIKFDDSASLATDTLVHSDGSTGASAQNKQTGTLSLTVAADFPDQLLYFDGLVEGKISVKDQPASFSELTLTGETQSINTNTGDLVVRGGAGIAGNLFLGGKINTTEIESQSLLLDSNTGIDIDINTRLRIIVNNNNIVSVTSAGLSGNISSAAISNSTIDNTTIGATTPSTAAFSAATVTNVSGVNSITNKKYVDETSTAFAIAFGL